MIKKIIIIKQIFISVVLLLASINNVMGATHINGTYINSYTLNTGEYILDNNVIANSTAFVVNQNNVVLYGNNHTVTFANKVTGYGITATGKHYLKVYDTKFVNTNTTPTNSYGIYLYNSDNSLIDNCNGTSYKAYGLYMRDTENTIVQNNDFISTSGTAIYFNNADRNIIFNNNIISNTGYALITDSAQNNTISYNTIRSTSNIGVSIPTTASYNNLHHNTISSSSNVAIRLMDSDYNTVSYNDIDSGTNIGLYLAYTTGRCEHNIVYGNNIDTFDSNAALYLYNADNNEINANVCFSNNSYGAYFRGSSNNEVSYNTFDSKYQYGFLIGYGSNGNNVNNNVFHSDEYKGIFVYNNTVNTFSSNAVFGKYTYAPVSNNHIMLIGDSITDGSASGVEYGAYSNVLRSTLTDYTITNIGFSGERATRGRERFIQNLDIFNPEIVFIGYGTNDLIDGRSNTDIINDITWMYDTAENRGIQVYIVNTLPIYTNNALRISLNQALDDLEGYRIINAYDIIDSVPMNNAYDSYVAVNYVDGIHPTTASNALIGANITTYLIQDYITLDREDDAVQEEITEFNVMWFGVLFIVIMGLIYNMMQDATYSTDPNGLFKLLILIVLIAITIQVIGNTFFL